MKNECETQASDVVDKMREEEEVPIRIGSATDAHKDVDALKGADALKGVNVDESSVFVDATMTTDEDNDEDVDVISNGRRSLPLPTTTTTRLSSSPPPPRPPRSPLAASRSPLPSSPPVVKKAKIFPIGGIKLTEMKISPTESKIHHHEGKATPSKFKMATEQGEMHRTDDVPFSG